MRVVYESDYFFKWLNVFNIIGVMDKNVCLIGYRVYDYNV